MSQVELMRWEKKKEKKKEMKEERENGDRMMMSNDKNSDGIEYQEEIRWWGRHTPPLFLLYLVRQSLTALFDFHPISSPLLFLTHFLSILIEHTQHFSFSFYLLFIPFSMILILKGQNNTSHNSHHITQPSRLSWLPHITPPILSYPT